jgi:ubiquinone/menaquinone biosynthesis C-methylase UbiE
MRISSSLQALVYDRMSATAEDAGLRELRRGLLADAQGRVLEIGGGTGANLLLYTAAVESLTVTEPERPMLRRLERKAREQAPRTRVLRARAEALPFPEGSFDTVVSTLVLCGVDDQRRSLREVRRVLRPGGRFLFLEHVRSDDPKLARLQDRMNSVNRFIVRCDCNRATLAAIEAEGFDVAKLERTVLPKAPPFARPLIVGVATGP